MKAYRLAGAVAAALLFAVGGATAEAAPVTYTFSGDFAGTFNGTSFDNTPVTFTGIGDTGSLISNGYSYYEQLSSLSARAINATFNVTEPAFFYINKFGYAGLEFGAFDDTSYFSGENESLIGYKGSSSVGTTPFNSTSFDEGQTAVVSTQYGSVVLNGESNGTFSAAVAAVPEPVTWAMMISGFGLVGGMMRRAHRKSEESFTRKVRSIATA